jgi:uncharacterized protein YbaR (Trm112 family)
VRDIVSNAAGKKVNLDKDLLTILCCPETKQAVALADEQLIQKVNGAIERGVLKNKAQKPVTEKLDGGLIRSDSKILYPRSRRHSCHVNRRRYPSRSGFLITLPRSSLP